MPVQEIAVDTVNSMSLPDFSAKALCAAMKSKEITQETLDFSSQQNPPSPPVICSEPTSESRASMTSSRSDICRICHCEAEDNLPLISPCRCSGSLKYVHQTCLQQWIKSADCKACELCKYDFVMKTKVKPFNKWEKLDMTAVERRKVFCSVTFHVIAITCVIWSLYVLIDRTTEEIRAGMLEWPFWTKLIVVAIGFTGGLVFMYVQCKMYLQLCKRWRAYNRVIYVEDGTTHNKTLSIDMAHTSKLDDLQEPSAPPESTVQIHPVPEDMA